MVESQHVWQALHSLVCCAAGQRARALTTSEELGHEAGARWSTIGALNRMTKLLGLSVRWSFIHASRVGNQ